MSQPERLPSGRWRIRFTASGKRETATFATKREADAFGDVARTQVREGTYRAERPEHSVTVAEWAGEFYALQSGLRRNTLARANTIIVNYVIPYWGARTLGSISRIEVQRWVMKMTTGEIRSVKHPDRQLAANSIDKNYRVFSKIILGAVDLGVLPHSPLPSKSGTNTRTTKAVRFLTPREVLDLADAIDPYYRVLITLACYTGLRIGELAALRVDDIDFDRCRLRVDEGQTDLAGILHYDEPKTLRGARMVPLTDLALADLDDHMRQIADPSDPRAFLFTSPRGCPFRITNFRRNQFNPAVTKAGLTPFTIHDMRHTAASFLIAEGANRWMLAEILGHTDTRMIDTVYGHLFPDDREDLRKRMGQRARLARPSPEA